MCVCVSVCVCAIYIYLYMEWKKRHYKFCNLPQGSWKKDTTLTSILQAKDETKTLISSIMIKIQ